MPNDHPNTSSENDKPQTTRFQRTTYSPADFDAAKCLPPKLRKFEEEARYLIGLIHWHTVTRFTRLSHRARNRGVELKATYLRRVMGSHATARIVGALVASDAITCDDRAIRGRKCFTYGLGPLFTGRFRRYRFRKPKIIKALASLRQREDEALTDLQRWLKGNQGRIAVDPRAYRAAKRLENPDARASARISLDALIRKDFWYRPDEYGWHHTNLTNLNGDLRKFLTVDGKPLISLDISCCHPIILGIMMSGHNLKAGRCPYFSSSRRVAASSSGDGGLAQPAASTAAANAAVRRRTTSSVEKQHHPHPHTLYDEQFRLHNTDAESNGKRAFLQAAESGTLYDTLAQHVAEPKANVKEAFLRMININTRVWKLHPKRMRAAQPLVATIMEATNDLFPGVMEYIEKAKRRDHRHLAWNMQRTEGYIIFQMICNQIHRQRPETFVATIHDAVLTTPDAADYVMQVMTERFADCGLHPKIKRQPA